MNNSAALRIRLPPELHREFLEVCKAQNKSAAQAIREFMRSHVSRYRQGQQIDLFQPGNTNMELNNEPPENNSLHTIGRST